MIISFKHKGLERFYRTGNTVGIQAKHAARISRILARLDSAETPADIEYRRLAITPLKRRFITALERISEWQLAHHV